MRRSLTGGLAFSPVRFAPIVGHDRGRKEIEMLICKGASAFKVVCDDI